MGPHLARGERREEGMSRLRYISLVGLFVVIVTEPATAAPPPPSPELHITFTGVLVYKRMDGPDLAYKVLAPDAPSHSGYVRFAVADYQPSSTLKPSGNPFLCDGGRFQYVSLDADGLAIEPSDAVIDRPPLRAGTAFDRIAHLKTLAGANSELDPDYDQPAPKPHRIAAQFLLDRGSVEPVVEPGYQPVIWDFWGYRKTITGAIQKTTACGVQLCGTSGVDLTLHLKDNSPISLVSSKDPVKRRLVLKPADGKALSITIGNSRKDDIVCQGMKHPVPDEDFLHNYKMVRKATRECMPFPALECGKQPGPPVSITSRGGSNCLGSQWP
jgi:hypothetical protein